MYFEPEQIIQFSDLLINASECDILFDYTYGNFLTRAVGLAVDPMKEWKPQTSEEQAFVASMPVYPAQGSVDILDELCIVKLSD